MLLVKFKKVDSFAFCSYLNCRDAIIQTIKRANIQVEYSQGFNPHELLYFSPPTSLGIESECEYFTIYTNDIFDFAGRFNANAPSGLQVIWTKEMNTRPDFYNLIDYAKFEIQTDSKKNEINLCNMDYDVFDEKKQSSINIHDLIRNIKFCNGKFDCVIACGQKSNLKIMNLVKCLKNSFDVNVLNIRKVELYKNESSDNALKNENTNSKYEQLEIGSLVPIDILLQ